MGKVGSFLLGGLVGAGVALILAPRSGEETRALIAEKADDYWGKGQAFYDQGKTYVRETVASAQPTINKKSDELRQKIDNARALIAEQVAKNASAAREVINEKVPVAADAINQAADVVRGQIGNAADRLKGKTAGAEGAADAVADAVAEGAAEAAEAAVAEVAEAAEPAVPLEVPNKVEPLFGEDA